MEQSLGNSYLILPHQDNKCLFTLSADGPDVSSKSAVKVNKTTYALKENKTFSSTFCIKGRGQRLNT